MPSRAELSTHSDAWPLHLHLRKKKCVQRELLLAGNTVILQREQGTKVAGNHITLVTPTCEEFCKDSSDFADRRNDRFYLVKEVMSSNLSLSTRLTDTEMSPLSARISFTITVFWNMTPCAFVYG